jgi:hypothetical protein
MTSAETTERIPAERLSTGAQIAAAARANLMPGLLLQAAALLLVLAYYFWPPARAAFEVVAAFKLRVGWIYSFVAMAFFAGILPVLLQRLQRGAAHESFRVLPFYAIFWAILGVVIDAFYNFQAVLFGQGTDVLTVVYKVAVDMLIFSPFFAMPLVMWSFAWKDNGFDFDRTRRNVGHDWYRKRVWPMLLAAWIVWIPAVALVYALPLALQFPIQNIVECLWVLILLFLTKSNE